MGEQDGSRLFDIAEDHDSLTYCVRLEEFEFP